RNAQQKTVLRWAFGILAVPPVVVTGMYLSALFGHGRAAKPDKPPDLAKIQAIIDTYSRGSVSQILRENWVAWVHELPVLLFSLYVVSLFLLGLWVWRSGIILRLDEYKPLLKKVCAWCLPFGIALNVLVFAGQHRPSTGHPTVLGYFSNLLN